MKRNDLRSAMLNQMTMVTHKTLLQPLRLHYVIESNAVGEEERGGGGGGKEEGRREGGMNWKTEKDTWSLRAPDDVVGSHNQFVHQHTEGVWPWVLNESPSMLVRGRQSNFIRTHTCMYGCHIPQQSFSPCLPWRGL